MMNWVEHPQTNAYSQASQNPIPGTGNNGLDRTFDGEEGDWFDYDIKNVNLALSPRCEAKDPAKTKAVCNKPTDGSTPANSYHFQLLTQRVKGTKPTAQDYARCVPNFVKRDVLPWDA